MSTSERRTDHAVRLAASVRRHIASDLRAARIAVGVSQREVALQLGISPGEFGRIERGDAPWMSVDVVVRSAVMLGLDPAIRFYPGGAPLRDRAHSALLERLHRILAPALTWRTEVPMPIPGDRRAWDAVIGGRDWRTAVEAEMRISDGQALARRIELKRRDSKIESVVVLVADTRANRDALRSDTGSLRASFPLQASAVVASLREGRYPGGSAIVRL